jgi:predicted ATPase
MNPLTGGRTVIVLTGGPCGGKTTLLRELERDPAFSGKYVAVIQTELPLISGISVQSQAGKTAETFSRSSPSGFPKYFTAKSGK